MWCVAQLVLSSSSSSTEREVIQTTKHSIQFTSAAAAGPEEEEVLWYKCTETGNFIRTTTITLHDETSLPHCFVWNIQPMFGHILFASSLLLLSLLQEIGKLCFSPEKMSNSGTQSSTLAKLRGPCTSCSGVLFSEILLTALHWFPSHLRDSVYHRLDEICGPSRADVKK